LKKRLAKANADDHSALIDREGVCRETVLERLHDEETLPVKEDRFVGGKDVHGESDNLVLVVIRRRQCPVIDAAKEPPASAFLKLQDDDVRSFAGRKGKGSDIAVSYHMTQVIDGFALAEGPSRIGAERAALSPKQLPNKGGRRAARGFFGPGDFVEVVHPGCVDLDTCSERNGNEPFVGRPKVGEALSVRARGNDMAAGINRDAL